VQPIPGEKALQRVSENGHRPKNYAVPAVQRALDILEFLVATPSPRNITEISKHLAIPKSSVFSILQTLRGNGYVEKLENDRYALTLKIFGLGSSIIASLDLRQQVAPVLRELAVQTNITGHLAVLASDEAVYIDKAEVPGAIRLTTYVGSRCPLHSTGMGKALLAWLPQSEVDRIVKSRGLTAYTRNTISSPIALKAELAQVRRLGYAVSIEENEPGVCGIAAPVFDHLGHVVAAVNLGGTILQIKKSDIPLLGATVAHAAEEMSRRLGYAAQNPA
jgi:IclR family KDG regulon transcriptional repressor